MPEILYTAAQVADLTGRKQSSIPALARRMKIGRKLGGNWIFTAADVETVRQVNRKGGRPVTQPKPPASLLPG